MAAHDFLVAWALHHPFLAQSDLSYQSEDRGIV